MKHMIWAIVLGGLLVAGGFLPAEAASGRGGGVHGGGARSPGGGAWYGGSPRGGSGVHGGGGYRGGAPGWGGGYHGPRPGWGGGYRGGGAYPYRYGGTRVFIGGGVGWWGGPGWWGYPGWWGASYPYYYGDQPVVVEPAPTEYIQPAPAPPAQDYWYYCQSAGMYYPYVKDCPGGWMQVVPSPAPSER